MRCFGLLLLFFAALSSLSCGGSAGKKVVYPTSGKILLNGKPAENALVVFHPLKGTDGESKPRGKVGPDGTYKLTTYDTDDGAPAGDYKVTVELWLAGKGDDPPTNRLSPKLANPETSGLTATVVAGPNEIKVIELKK